MSYSDLPVPDSYPVFMSHEHVLKYLELYSNHFKLRDCIVFGAAVSSIHLHIPTQCSKVSVHPSITCHAVCLTTHNEVTRCCWMPHHPSYNHDSLYKIMQLLASILCI